MYVSTVCTVLDSFWNAQGMSCVHSSLQHVTLTQWCALTYTTQLPIQRFY
jgi:hypothetical protein